MKGQPFLSLFKAKTCNGLELATIRCYDSVEYLSAISFLYQSAKQTYGLLTMKTDNKLFLLSKLEV